MAIQKSKALTLEQIAGSLSDCTTAEIEEAVQKVGGIVRAGDIPALRLMIEENRKGVTTKSSLAKAAPTAPAKLDSSNLPVVSTLSQTEVVEQIKLLNQMHAQDVSTDEALVGYYAQLWQRRKEFMEMSRALQQALTSQDSEYQQSVNDLLQVGSQAVKGLKDNQELLRQLGEGGARLGDNFRKSQERRRELLDGFAALTQPPASA